MDSGSARIDAGNIKELPQAMDGGDSINAQVILTEVSMAQEPLVKRPALFVLPVLMVLLSLVMSPLAHAERKLLDQVVVVVNDGVILQSELTDRINVIKARLARSSTQLPPESDLRARVLEQLVSDTIQLQMAEQMGMRVSDNELNSTMQTIARNNGLTLDQFEARIQSEGLSYGEAREQFRREILISRVQQRRVDSRIRVTQREVDNYLAAVADRKGPETEYHLAHILVAVDDFGDEEAVAEARAKAESLLRELRAGRDFGAAAVAESDANNALEGGELGWRPESQLPSLVEAVVPDMKPGQISDVLQSGSGFHLVKLIETRGGEAGQELVEQSKVRHILVQTDENTTAAQAQAELQEVVTKLNAGESFEALAREISEDPGSASEGGELGWVSPGQMVPAFERAMTNAEVGEIVGPFQSRFGWHVLQVTDRREQDMTNELAANKARQSIYMRKYESELQNWLTEIRDEAFVEYKADNTEGTVTE